MIPSPLRSLVAAAARSVQTGAVYCEQNGKRGSVKPPPAGDSPEPMTAYLAKLNPEQRRAVEHGVGAPDDRPLRVSAGGGPGKTNPPAHRVAHLIVNGVDPRRLLLMTFSRRAAAEMERRVRRIVAAAPGGAALAAAALARSGTRHSTR